MENDSQVAEFTSSRLSIAVRSFVEILQYGGQ